MAQKGPIGVAIGPVKEGELFSLKTAIEAVRVAEAVGGLPLDRCF